MKFCSNCGANAWEYLESGGFGGYAEVKACTACKTVYRKESGGVIHTGEEKWTSLSENLDEYKERRKGKKAPERLRCIDKVSLCEPNKKPPGHCNGCGG